MNSETIVRRITTWTVAWLAAAAIAALGNWYAVEREAKTVEYVAKPATTTLLIGAALALVPDTAAQRWWFVAALALCLAGDVFLMLPADRFVAGLASFLLGHILFIVGFFAGTGQHNPWLLVVALSAIGLSARPVLQGATAQDPRLRVPVVSYMAVIATMLVISARAGSAYAVAGAFMFVVSDSILARNRFVAPIAHGRLATMVTYHAALALLVVSLSSG